MMQIEHTLKHAFLLFLEGVSKSSMNQIQSHF